METILLVLFYTLFPAMVILLEKPLPILKKIGPVIICYATGLIIGNIGILPDNAREIQDTVSEVAIPLAIPLLLFSLNLRAWVKMAGKTFFSMLLGLISVIVVVWAGYYFFRDELQESWKIAGMLVGVYSGGTPNLAAIKLALNVDPNTYLLTHTYDLFFGILLLLFLITIGQRFFMLFMKPFKHTLETDDLHEQEDSRGLFNEIESYKGIFKKKNIVPLMGALGLAVLIFGLGGSMTLFVPGNSQMVAVILTITSLGIIASLFKRINRIPKTFQLGMYFIYVFCVVVASMADIHMFTELDRPLFLYVFLAVYATMALHAILSALFRVDADNMIITSVALSMSPPFVPVIAAAIKNREIIISGLFIGIIGYAIGNYLGVFVGYLLK